MKLLLTLLYGMGCCALLNAQSLSPSVIAIDGGIAQTQNMSISWTLGESVIETIHEKKTIYTQGFHQPTLEVRNLNFVGHPDSDVEIFPNPTSAVLNLSFGEPSPSDLHLVLTDMSGKVVLEEDIGEKIRSHQLNLEQFPASIFILNLLDGAGNKYPSFIISKSQ